MGRLLSEQTGWPFVDMDAMIEEMQGRSVAAIFEAEGEAYFRQLERALLEKLVHAESSVIATGGGVPCTDGNMELMKSSGTLVYMRCTPLELFQYLEANKGDRPLLKGKQGADLFEWIDSELQRRAPFYNKADLIVEAYYVTADEVWERIRSFKK